jgi:RNA polymerase sigma-70 factor (ECF subfamily)
MLEFRRASYERLVRAYSGEVYRYAYWLCRDRFVAEDLVQETFVRAWTSGSLRDYRAARKWLYTIVRREYARLFERKRLPIAQDADLDAIPDERLASASGEIEMREALAHLPELYREPLLLQVMGGFTCEEIGKIMHLSPGAVMTRLSRARLALRRLPGYARAKAASR